MFRSAGKCSVALIHVLWLLQLWTCNLALGDEVSQVYDDGDTLVVWADKTYPISNPQETYSLSSSPLCEFTNVTSVLAENKKSMGIGEQLEGHSLQKSPKIDIKFNVNVQNVTMCEMVPTEEQANHLRSMIVNNYEYLYYIDELPIESHFGEVANDQVARVFTHRTFEFLYNEKQIIRADINPSSPFAIQGGLPLKFTYSVEWQHSNVTFKDRFNRYLDESFFEHKIHWFSVINSTVLCIFLCAVVVIILARTLKNDFARYAASEGAELESLDRADDSGWKQIHGDVFRRPPHLQIFSVCFASGIHIGLTVAVFIALLLANSYYAQRGMTLTACLMVYVILQPVSGFAGGFVFRMYGGKSWRAAMFSQLFTLPLLAAILGITISVVAASYSSSMTLSLRAVINILALFFFVCAPLHFAGTKFGRSRGAAVTFPCRVHQLQRPIPQKSKLFLPLSISLSGLVPFGCVFVEMYFLFQAFWNYKFYYLYGFIAIVFTLLCLVLVCVSITCVYLLLDSEDYRWTWVSFVSCGSIAVYAMIYAIYYFHSTLMHGLLQSSLYFATTTLLCVCLALFAGSLGYVGAARFVWLIYNNIKID